MPMMNDPAPWQTLRHARAYRSRWVGVSVDTVLLPNGADVRVHAPGARRDRRRRDRL